MLTTFYGHDATRDVRDAYWRDRYRRLFAAGEAFLVEGSTLGRCLQEAGCPPEKIRIHHLGVDLERIEYRPRRPASVVRFLICAPFREKKGIPYGIRALGQAVREGRFPCQIVLIGAGPEEARIRAEIREAGLGEMVTLRGPLPYSQVLRELAQCHILLQPSVTAADGDSEGGAPVILLDAQAAGVPVVATTHADIPEYVRAGETGWLAPERDVEALADCIRRLVAAPETWETLGRAGRRHVERDYNAAVQATRLEQLYDEFA